MRIIIYGIGKVGTKLAQTLYQEGQDITIIDNDKEKIENIQNKLDVLSVLGHIGQDSTIRQAKIKNADVFIAVTDSDEENIVACLIAKRQNIKKIIARLRNPSYLNQELLVAKELGINHIINPEREVAREIFKLIIAPWAMEVHSFMQGHVSFLELQINEHNIGYLTQKLKLIAKTNTVVIISPEDSKKSIRFFEKGSSFKVNDQVCILVPTQKIDEINKIFEDTFPKIKNLMIMGGGQTACELLNFLQNTVINIKVIDNQSKTCESLNDRFKNAIVLCGDATDLDFLSSENIEKIDCFVAITGDDESNIMMSLFALKKGVKKAITKISKQYGEDILGGIGLYTSVSQQKATVNKILSLVSKTELVAFSTSHQDSEIMEFWAGPNSKIVKKPLKNSKFIPQTLIAAIYHNGKITFPKNSFKIEPNSRVLIISKKKVAHKIERYFRS